MKTLSVITAALFLAFGVATSRAQNLDRISTATGVPIETLQAERASTGLGWGSLEKAHLLSNATGQSFDNVVALHQSGQGWGKIAHDNGAQPRDAREQRSPLKQRDNACEEHENNAWQERDACCQRPRR